MESTSAHSFIEQILNDKLFASAFDEALTDQLAPSRQLIAREALIRVLLALRARINSDRDTIMKDPLLRTHIARWGFSFYRVGVAVRDASSRYLMVEESRVRVNGVYQPVHDIWNFPSGSVLNPSESLHDAALREVKEETGYSVDFTGLLYVKHKISENSPYTMTVYAAKPKVSPPADCDHEEILSCRWLTVEEIAELDRQGKLRSPDFVKRAIDLYESGKILPLSVITE